jgi:hypothetical protein
MKNTSVIIGINWVTAVAAVAFVLFQICAPIPPDKGPIRVIQPLKPTNALLQPNGSGRETSSPALDLPSTPVSGQQKPFPSAQPQQSGRNAFRSGSAAASNASANQSSASANTSVPLPQSNKNVAIAPAYPSPPPSAGAENLPDYMRYF